MSQMENYYHQLGNDITVGNYTTTTDAYPGDYFYYPEYPTYHYWYTYPHYENKKERAYEILKVLVKEEMIKEPKSFKKFCDLIEKIGQVI